MKKDRLVMFLVTVAFVLAFVAGYVTGLPKPLPKKVVPVAAAMEPQCLVMTDYRPGDETDPREVLRDEVFRRFRIDMILYRAEWVRVANRMLAQTFDSFPSTDEFDI